MKKNTQECLFYFIDGACNWHSWSEVKRQYALLCAYYIKEAVKASDFLRKDEMIGNLQRQALLLGNSKPSNFDLMVEELIKTEIGGDVAFPHTLYCAAIENSTDGNSIQMKPVALFRSGPDCSKFVCEYNKLGGEPYSYHRIEDVNNPWAMFVVRTA